MQFKDKLAAEHINQFLNCWINSVVHSKIAPLVEKH